MISKALFRNNVPKIAHQIAFHQKAEIGRLFNVILMFVSYYSNLYMALKKPNPPSPEILMNSMRSMGYTFKSAVADIIDNSISADAENIDLFFPDNDSSPEEQLYIAILDDGCGMDYDELFNAMKYGTDRGEYSDKDLGRFGVGLKTASLSVCRVLTVVSKKDGVISAFRWDLDEVTNSQEWNCLELEKEDIEECPCINALREKGHGTLVIWQNFDLAKEKVQSVNSSNRSSKDNAVWHYISDQLSNEVEPHIKLTFHMFMAPQDPHTHRVDIYINGRKLIPVDPFYDCGGKTDSIKPMEQPVRDSNGDIANIKVTGIILPHMNDLTIEDMEHLGGEHSLGDGQGFYIYRNNRLIIYGTWFKLTPSDIDMSVYKYGRIKVEIPNTLDKVWDIDIKKQNAVIPKQVINVLKRTVDQVTGKSKERDVRKHKVVDDSYENNIWEAAEAREGHTQFKVNVEAPVIKDYLEENFDKRQQKKVIHLLDIISEKLPFDDIYQSVVSGRNSQELTQDEINEFVIRGIRAALHIKKTNGCTLSEAVEELCKQDPYSRKCVHNALLEVLYDDL